MKKLLLILLCLPLLTLAQETYVPDNNFEAYLEGAGMGNGIPNDDYVTTANIVGQGQLDISSQGISDLTGIEDFTALWNFACYENQITSLYLLNPNLTFLDCSDNQLTSLDVSHNTGLYNCYCFSNQLTSLDLRNGNNINFYDINATNNPNLTCISVDYPFWSTTNWTVSGNYIDPQMYFSADCSVSGIEEYTTNKELLKVTDILGRETKQINQPLFYIYDDGTVEKRIVID